MGKECIRLSFESVLLRCFFKKKESSEQGIFFHTEGLADGVFLA